MTLFSTARTLVNTERSFIDNPSDQNWETYSRALTEFNHKDPNFQAKGGSCPFAILDILKSLSEAGWREGGPFCPEFRLDNPQTWPKWAFARLQEA